MKYRVIIDKGREKQAQDMALEGRKTTADEGPSRGEREKIKKKL